MRTSPPLRQSLSQQKRKCRNTAKLVSAKTKMPQNGLGRLRIRLNEGRRTREVAVQRLPDPVFFELHGSGLCWDVLNAITHTLFGTCYFRHVGFFWADDGFI